MRVLYQKSQVSSLRMLRDGIRAFGFVKEPLGIGCSPSRQPVDSNKPRHLMIMRTEYPVSS